MILPAREVAKHLAQHVEYCRNYVGANCFLLPEWAEQHVFALFNIFITNAKIQYFDKDELFITSL